VGSGLEPPIAALLVTEFVGHGRAAGQTLVDRGAAGEQRVLVDLAVGPDGQ